jgi:RNA polymerase sigma-70 factor (ECF subfamily)
VERPVVYCILPRELASKLRESLRLFYTSEPAIRVVVERREIDRRTRPNRRMDDRAVGTERRLVRSKHGRRVADRRAMVVAVSQPPVPRLARRHADRLLFVERIEPTRLDAEDIDTNRIIARVQAGDGSAFGQLYLRYFDRLYSYAHVALREPYSAEDVTQQSFLRALEALPGFEIRPDSAFRAWLFRIARNETLQLMRKHGRLVLEEPERVNERLASVGEDAASVLSWISDDELLMFVERLPLAPRQALMLYYRLGFTVEEIAVILDRTPESVRQLRSRALRFLADRLTALGHKPDRAQHQPMLVVLRHATVLRSRRFSLQQGIRPRPARWAA